MTTTLTGRHRHRVQQRWFREPVLVLQVEQRVQGQHMGEDWRGPYYDGPSYDRLEWRDAMLEDFPSILSPTVKQ